MNVPLLTKNWKKKSNNFCKENIVHRQNSGTIFEWISTENNLNKI